MPIRGGQQGRDGTAELHSGDVLAQKITSIPPAASAVFYTGLILMRSSASLTLVGVGMQK